MMSCAMTEGRIPGWLSTRSSVVILPVPRATSRPSNRCIEITRNGNVHGADIEAQRVFEHVQIDMFDRCWLWSAIRHCGKFLPLLPRGPEQIPDSRYAAFNFHGSANSGQMQLLFCLGLCECDQKINLPVLEANPRQNGHNISVQAQRSGGGFPLVSGDSRDQLAV